MKNQLTHTGKILLFFFTLASLSVSGQITEFQRTIGGSKKDNGYALDRTPDGNYIITGYTESFGKGGKDVLVTKVNGLGQPIWSKAIGGTGDETGWKVRATRDSGYVVVGTTNSFNNGNADGLIFKLDKNGSLVWSNRLATDSIQDIYDIIESRFGGFYLTGVNDIDSLNEELFLARVTAGGTLIWWKNYGTNMLEEGYGLDQDNIGNVYVVGKTNSDSITVGAKNGTFGDEDVVVLKTDSAGKKKWMFSYGTTGKETGWGIDVANNNSIYVTGWSSGFSSNNEDIFVMNLDSVGKTNFLHVYGSPESERAFSVKSLLDGTYAVGGYFNDGLTGDRHMLFLNANSNGQLLISETIGNAPGKDGDWPTDLVEVNDKGLMLLSTSQSFTSNGVNDIWLVKTDGLRRASCNQQNVFITPINGSFSTSGFGFETNSAGYNKISLTNTSISSANDSTHCCQLNAEVAADTVTICGDESVRIGRRSVSGISYTWTANGSVISNSGNPSVKPSTTTKYKVVVSSTDNQCASDSAEIVVKVNTKRSDDFARDTSFCDGDSVIFVTAGNMNLYLWNGEHITSNSQSIKLKKADTIAFFGIDKNSCTYRDTMVVTVFDRTQFNLGNDTSICEFLPLTLKGPSGMVSYTWNTGAGTDSISVNNDGTYSLTVVNTNGCESSDAISVFTNPTSTFSLGADSGFCLNSSFLIRGPGALTDFIWNDTASTQLNLRVTEAGMYTLTASNSFGCPYTDTINLITYALPEFSLGSDTGVCNEGMTSIKLVGPAGVSKYLWSTGSVLDELSLNSPGTYWLEVTGDKDCKFRDSIEVVRYPDPEVDLGPDTTICFPSESIVLQGGAGFSAYAWSTGETSEDITVSDSGVYSVTVTDQLGCQASDEVIVDTVKCANIQSIPFVGITAYPNPASGQITIEANDNLNDAVVEVYDALGRKRAVRLVRTNRAVQMDLSDLENGQYFVRLYTANKMSTLFIHVQNNR
jgi:hypothetical protein